MLLLAGAAQATPLSLAERSADRSKARRGKTNVIEHMVYAIRQPLKCQNPFKKWRDKHEV
ncbi:hypothetical protein COPEUT_00603 [Coprococcus eutactus ATCC 27759]|nr:hypothetical protein COPEUT_00603 [Coprococcus eutactus ATCC 27759]